jgi:uncharacterized Ntn-hydrolase superfamily protein
MTTSGLDCGLLGGQPVLDYQVGALFSTFSVVGRCSRTGKVGVGIATRALAVSARCPHAKANVGAVTTQAYTDPRLGYLAMRLLELGFSAERVVDELVRSDPHHRVRQLAVVDRDGNAAAYTGEATSPWSGHLKDANVVALGNYLLGGHVVQAIFEAFQSTAGQDLEERLLRAIEAGRDAGGQHEGQRSAGLLVYDRAEYPWIDLRVDEHTEPIGELRRVFEVYKPLREYFNLRPSNPALGRENEWLAARGAAG